MGGEGDCAFLLLFTQVSACFLCNANATADGVEHKGRRGLSDGGCPSKPACSLLGP